MEVQSFDPDTPKTEYVPTKLQTVREMWPGFPKQGCYCSSIALPQTALPMPGGERETAYKIFHQPCAGGAEGGGTELPAAPPAQAGEGDG